MAGRVVAIVFAAVPLVGVPGVANVSTTFTSWLVSDFDVHVLTGVRL